MFMYVSFISYCVEINFVGLRLTYTYVGEKVGSMNEESQVRGCYNITFIYTNQETV